MPAWLEQTVGGLLLELALLDVFLEVLYARLGTGILAPRISKLLWRLFLWASRPMGRQRADAKDCWRRRYAVALRRLQQAGIRTVSDEGAGARHYVALREQGDGAVRQLASALAYSREEIDPAGTHPERMVERAPRMTELAREPFPEGPHQGPGPLH